MSSIQTKKNRTASALSILAFKWVELFHGDSLLLVKSQYYHELSTYFVITYCQPYQPCPEPVHHYIDGLRTVHPVY